MSIKIAVASGKGGTGKTTVAVNLFQLLNREQQNKTLLVDCDVEEPNDMLFFPEAQLASENTVLQEIPRIDTSRCTFCRKCSEYCEFNAIVVIPPAGFAEVNSSLCHSCGACMVACQDDAIWVKDEPIGTIKKFTEKEGTEILEGRLKIGSAMQTMVIRSLKRDIPADEKIIILDAPPGTSCPVVETVSDADFVILVTEPTPFGMYDLKLMIALVREMDKPFGVVINKADLGNQDLFQYLEKENIEIISEIPFSKAYASQYARADIFRNVPDEIDQAFRKIVANLSMKGLIQ